MLSQFDIKEATIDCVDFMALRWSDWLTGFYDEEEIKLPKLIIAGSCREDSINERANYVILYNPTNPSHSLFSVFRACG